MIEKKSIRRPWINSALPRKYFPDNKDAIAKYEEAKALFDAEQAGKELEARYKKYCDDGEKAMTCEELATSQNAIHRGTKTQT
jgi:hypothetical protein